MIPYGKGWHYLSLKKLSTLLRRITSKHYDDFFVWMVFIPLEQQKKLELHKGVSENKDF